MRKLFGALALVLVSTASWAQDHWVASWATAEQIAEPENMAPPAVMQGATLRQIIRLSIGGAGYRLRISNVFGAEPLHLKGVHVAKTIAQDAIDPSSDRVLTFSGATDAIIPAGASYVSDPVMMPVAPLSDLSISIYYDEAPRIQTSHPGSRMTSYAVSGDHLSDARFTDPKTMDHWYQIASVDVLAAPDAGAVVAIGDSITDGRGSTTNGNDRWTNILALRLNTAGRRLAVLNAGLGGNRLLNDGKGPNALSRIDRDVLAPSGASAVIVLEGINDLGTLTREHAVPFEEHDKLVHRIIGAYQQIATAAHAHGMKAYIGTVMPFMGFEYYHPVAANEVDRNAVNAWIRVQKEFDGVIDFDALLRDPAHPDHLSRDYDSGDGIHPSPAGYRVMGEAAAKVLLGAHPGKKHK